MRKRIGLACFAVALAMLIPQLAAADDDAVFPDTIALPNGFRPEGIAIGRGTTVYIGSIPTGAILRLDARTGRTRTVVPGRADPRSTASRPTAGS